MSTDVYIESLSDRRTAVCGSVDMHCADLKLSASAKEKVDIFIGLEFEFAIISAAMLISKARRFADSLKE